MSQAWTSRPYRERDEAGILDLYREVFGLEMPRALWRWVYQQSPDGPAVIAVLESGSRLIGHYAVQPRRFWVRGGSCLAGLALGTMVSAPIRSVAALVALAEVAYQTCRERGYSWLYAFPNDQAHKVRCALLGWRELPQI